MRVSLISNYIFVRTDFAIFRIVIVIFCYILVDSDWKVIINKQTSVLANEESLIQSFADLNDAWDDEKGFDSFDRCFLRILIACLDTR